MLPCPLNYLLLLGFDKVTGRECRIALCRLQAQEEFSIIGALKLTLQNHDLPNYELDKLLFLTKTTFTLFRSTIVVSLVTSKILVHRASNLKIFIDR